MRADITYKGPALELGEMDVHDLAPALLALGALMQDANRTANGNRATLTVNVRALRAGSFGIELLLKQDIVQHAQALLDGESVHRAKELLELVFGNKGLLALLAFAKRKPTSREHLPDGHVQFADGDTKFVVNATVAQFFDSPSMSGHARDALRPLQKEGITSVEVAADGVGKATWTKRDIENIEGRTVEHSSVLSDSTAGVVLEIVTVSFSEDGAWRLGDGSTTFWVRIDDADFRERVSRRELSFAKGDLLNADVRTITTQVDGKLHTERIAIHVKGVIQADKQTGLFDVLE